MVFVTSYYDLIEISDKTCVCELKMSGAPGPGGRGGRGAVLLEALKAKNRRPGEETPAASDGAAAAPPPAGRAGSFRIFIVPQLCSPPSR